MEARIEGIKTDIVAVTDKLDALMTGQTVEAGYLIECFIGTLEGHIRAELPLIDEAIK